jgi:Elongation factor G, domain IV
LWLLHEYRILRTLQKLRATLLVVSRPAPNAVAQTIGRSIEGKHVGASIRVTPENAAQQFGTLRATAGSSRLHLASFRGFSPRGRAAGGLPRGVGAGDRDRLHAQEADGRHGRLEPNEPGAGNEFLSEIVSSVVPKEYIPGVERGV